MFSSSPGQQKNAVNSLREASYGPEVNEGDKLKIREAEQGSVLVFEHLEDVFDMKGGSVKAKAERLHNIGPNASRN